MNITQLINELEQTRSTTDTVSIDSIISKLQQVRLLSMQEVVNELKNNIEGIDYSVYHAEFELSNSCTIALKELDLDSIIDSLVV